jgi:hypothetical protein
VRSLTIDRAAGAVFAAFSIFVLWECRKIALGFMAEPGPGLMPVILASSLLACSLALIAGRSGARLADVTWPEWRQAAAILASCAFMALAIERLGYRLTIFIVLLVLTGVVEGKGWVASALFAGGFAVGTYFLFNTLLRLPLPLGPFGL